MGINPAVFESAGKRSEHFIPGVYSRSAAVPSGGGGVSAGNGVILGRSKGGIPHHMYIFNSLSEAIEALSGGDLLEAVGHAFVGNGDYKPQNVRAMRVNNGTQATLSLSAGDTEVMRLSSWDYGNHMNQLKLKLEINDRKDTWKVTLNYQGNEEKIENIKSNALKIRCTEEDSYVTLTIDNDEMIIDLNTIISESNEFYDPSDPDDSEFYESVKTTETVVLKFSDFPTLGELCDRLNDIDFLAAVFPPDGNPEAASNELDNVVAKNITVDEVILTSNYYALFHALENTIVIGKGNVVKPNKDAPNIIPSITNDIAYFTGGTEGSSDVGDYIKALDILEGEDVQCISTPSTDHGIHIAIKNHCEDMSSVHNRKERTAFVGGALNETIEDAIKNAKNLNSKYISYCYNGITVGSPLTGKVKTLPASYFACRCLGMEMGAPINTPLTFKNQQILDFEYHLKNSELEQLIKGGVLAGGIADDGNFVVIRAMTTYQSNVLQLCERSMVRGDLYMNRDLRLRFRPGVGQPSLDPSGTDALATLLKAASDWLILGLINKNENGQDVWGITIRKDGDQTRLSFSRNLTPPQNFFFLTANNYVYSSSTALVVA